LDSIAGLIRTPWIQSEIVAGRPDVCIFTRPNLRLRQSNWPPTLKAVAVKPDRAASETKSHGLRTVLVDGNSNDLFGTLEWIENHSRPFVFILDGLPAGCRDNVAKLDKELLSIFPRVPRFIVSEESDTATYYSLKHNNSDSNFFRIKSEDALLIETGTANKYLVSIVSDPTGDKYLREFSYKLSSLEKLLASEDINVRNQAIKPLRKVFATLSSLLIPLTAYEELHTSKMGLGRFSKVPLFRLVERAANIQCRFGDSIAAIQECTKYVATLLKFFMNSETGKTQAFRVAAVNASQENRKLLVLAGSQVEADGIRTWLEYSCGVDVGTKVIVHAMDGVRGIEQRYQDVEQIVVAGTLWYNRRHWLSHPSRFTQVYAYDFEASAIEEGLAKWWKLHCSKTRIGGDKLKCLLLSWPKQGRLLDSEETISGSIPVSTELIEFQGKYEKQHSSVEVIRSGASKDWLEALLAEPTPSEDDDVTTYEKKEIVWIKFKGREELLCWPLNKTLLQIKNEALEVVLPDALNRGDEVVLMLQNSAKEDAHNEIFQVFLDDSVGLEQHLFFAEKWHVLVDKTFEKCSSIEAMRNLLEANSIYLTKTAIRNWLRHGVIGPDNPTVIKVFAKYLNHPNADSHAKKVGNAIAFVRQEHRNIGRDLRKAIMAVINGAASVQMGKKTFSAQELNSLIQIVEFDRLVVSELAPRLGNVG
jgi:hypothetical protein